MRATTFTTFINAQQDPGFTSTFDKAAQTAVSRYATITRAAERASAATAGLLNGKGGAGAGGSVTTSLQQRGRAMSDIAERAAAADRATVRLTSSTNAEANAARNASVQNEALSRSLRTTATALAVVQGPLGPLAGRVTAVSRAVEELTGARLGLAAVGASLFGITRVAGDYQDLTNKLKPLSANQEDFNRNLATVIGIAGRSRQALEPVIELYSRLSLAGKDVGLSQARIARITEIASKGAALSGGTNESRAAGLLQLSQGLGSGTFAGDELKSVRENLSAVAIAIAHGFKNADGTIGTTISHLKDLGAEGKLTSEAVADALERASLQDIELPFSKLQPTLRQAATAFGTTFEVIIGKFDEAVGITGTLAKGLLAIGDNLRVILSLAVGVGAAFAGPRLAAPFIAGATAVGNYYNQLSRTASLARGNALLDRQFAIERAAQTTAAIAETEARIAALNREKVAQQANIVALQQQRVAAQARLAQAQGQVYALGSPAGSRQAIELEAARAQLATVTRQLAVAEAELAGTTAALTAEQKALQIQTAANTEAVAAMNVTMAASVPRAGATAVALSALRSAGGLLVTVLTSANFWLLAVTTALLLVATRASAAKEAIDNFSGGQEELNRRLGITTDSLYKQSAAARELGIRLANNEVIKARSKVDEASNDLSKSLDSAASQLSGQDRRTVLALSDKAQQSRFRLEDFRAIEDIQRRNPDAFKGDIVSRFFGADPSEVAEKVRGVGAAFLSLKDAEKAAQDVLNPPKEGPAGVAGPESKSIQELKAQAQVDAIDGGTSAIKAAGDRRRLALEKLDQAFKPFIKNGVLQGDKTEDYQKQATAIEATYTREVNAAHAATQATRDHNKALRDAARDAKQAAREQAALERENAQKGLDTASTALEQRRPTINRQQYLDERIAILQTYDDEINKISKTDAYSHKAADQRRQDAADVAAAETEIANQLERQQVLGDLRVSGHDQEAQVLERTLDLYDRIGDKAFDQVGNIQKQLQVEQQINDALASRQRVASLVQGTVDLARDSFEKLLTDLPEKGPKAAGDFLKSMQGRISQIAARSLTERLFAGADEKVRALISGGNSAEEQVASLAKSITSASDGTDKLASATEDAAKRITAAAENISSGGGSTSAASGKGDVGGTGTNAINLLKNGGTGDDASPDYFGINDTANDPITVVANKFSDNFLKKSSTNLGLGSGKNALNATFSQFGANLDKTFKSGSFFQGIGGAFGTALQGAGTGAIASGFLKAFGIQQSKTGAQIGGAIGGLTGIPGGDIIGGIIGGTIGGLFKKTKKASATLTSDEFGNLAVGSVTGNTGSYKQQATKDLIGVIGGVEDVAEQLGGGINAALGSISIGKRKKKFVVDFTGQGRTKGADTASYDSEEEAVQHAIQDLIYDGVITGISNASKKLLQTGDDFQRQLKKAVAIEQIPKQLMALQDPVRYAVTTLNDQFKQLISYLQEGGASAAEFADAQKLYDLQRADAIKQAQEQVSGAIQDFLDQMRNSTASPFDKRTTYENAQGALGGFVADIQAGKKVDENDLLQAAQNFQDASRSLYGSSEAFFSDFDFLSDLLEKAKANAEAGISNDPLPSSPFDTPDVQAAIAGTSQQQVDAINNQTGVLSGQLSIIQQLLAAMQNKGNGTDLSSVNLLPAFS